MQTVISRPNPAFVVEPLQTVATTIISRTKALIPVDNPGSYGNSARNNRRSNRFKFTFGNNDAGFDPQNLMLVFDLTPSWYNTSVFAPLAAQFGLLTPNFDQAVDSLLMTVRIRTPNGAVIEEFPAYNEFGNIVKNYLQSATKKERSLYSISSFSKSPFKEQGLDPVLDGYWDKTLATNSIGHGQTRRILIPFSHCAWFNKEKFIPLQLLRNGIEIECEFEDPYRAFVYDSVDPLDRYPRWPALNHKWITGRSPSSDYYNWFVAPGSIWMSGDIVTIDLHNTANTYSVAGPYHLPAIWNANFPGAASGTAPQTTDFKKFKNLLYLKSAYFTAHFEQTAAYKLIQDLTIAAPTGKSGETIESLVNAYGQDPLFAVPVTIYRHGKCAWRGIAAWSLQSMATGLLDDEDKSNLTYAAEVLVNMTALANVRWKYKAAASTAVRDNAGSGSAWHSYITLPLYNWSHYEDGIADGNFGGNSIPFGCFNTDADLSNFLTDLAVMQAEIVIAWEDEFIIPIEPGNSEAANAANAAIGSATFVADPRQHLLSIWAVQRQNPMQWDYEARNLSLLVDFIKPASDITSNFITSFSAATGIPYAFPRVLRTIVTFDAGFSGLRQVVLPFSVRSLSSLLIAFKDPYCNNYGDSNTVNYLPCLSSFQRRGLSRIEVSIGGSRKPEYILQLDKHGGVEHIPEACNALGLAATTGFDQSFQRIALGPIRNYSNCGSFDYNQDQLNQMWTQRQTPTAGTTGYLQDYTTNKSYGLEYADSSAFVLAIDFSKSDALPFASGLDTSMSGQLIVNLYFNQDADPTVSGTSFDPGNGLRRGVTAVFYGVAHNVLTLNNNAITSRM